MSNDGTIRAMQRIAALIERGQDPVQGTLRRLDATGKVEKIQGIYYAALTMAEKSKKHKSEAKAWLKVAEAAKAKFRS
jgi:hypothetical protein